MNPQDYNPPVSPLEFNLPTQTVRIAVVQVGAVAGGPDEQLAHITELARDAAREHRPDILLLPEGLTCSSIDADRLLAAPRPIDAEPYQALRGLALELKCFVGGGFLAVRGNHVRSTHVLVEPDGSTHLHDKDQPSVWEGAFSAPGSDDGFTATSLGPVGVVLGEEWGRTRTAIRLRKAVRLLLGGAGSWTAPSPPLVGHVSAGGAHDYNLANARHAAVRLARVVGAPAAIAQQVATGAERRTGAGGVAWTVERLGESRIVARDGTTLAQLSASDGEGHVSAEVELTEPAPLEEIPRGEWLAPPSRFVRTATRGQYIAGRVAYKRRQRIGGFPWQPTVAERDLFAYNPAYDIVPPEQRRERRYVIPAEQAEGAQQTVEVLERKAQAAERTAQAAEPKVEA